eukprot:GFUD01001396.1.p1 GENE.GFUD01001396.1~~GFUD01001396.1.p1  ORF type:complete len:196 (+),score=55.38 GFUD01001396.1:295-882(+)
MQKSETSLVIAISLLLCVPDADTRVLGNAEKMVIANTANEEINIVGENRDENVNTWREISNTENEIAYEKLRKLSKFELTLVRCCSSNMDTKVGRCFEVNGFGGSHFLKKPCEHLEKISKFETVTSKKGVIVEERSNTENDIVRKVHKLTKFELTIVRCCASNMDTKVERCFEVNGFGGSHFIKKPCEHLEKLRN